jgi:hypothetical protein
MKMGAGNDKKHCEEEGMQVPSSFFTSPLNARSHLAVFNLFAFLM